MSFTDTAPIVDGQRLSDRFVVKKLHANGRYTRIYHAIDAVHGSDCAIKSLGHVPRRLQLQVNQRMKNEAQILSDCDHPHILRSHWDATDEKPAYLAVEWIGAGTLYETLAQRGPLSLTRVLRMTSQILDALAYLHRRGIIHRDIKPDNLLLRGGIDAVLCDFGIARMPAESKRRLTGTNAMMGSLNFMAPEQRVDARNAGPSSDLYSVGCTMYQVLTGWSPYNLFMAQRSSPRWAVLREDLADVLFHATRTLTDRRFRTAAEFRDALDRCSGGDDHIVKMPHRISPIGRSRTLPLEVD
ncbi:MAG: serine/threonine-protein kinase [Myxococcota bacterium]